MFICLFVVCFCRFLLLLLIVFFKLELLLLFFFCFFFVEDRTMFVCLELFVFHAVLLLFEYAFCTCSQHLFLRMTVGSIKSGKSSVNNVCF